ncbi:hypothetical protein [Clostridium sp.]|uniref:hypothetical protein n=1 Tax=Clostridium sp. TaxID=1506 RepID=UPI003F7DD27D
MKNNSNNIEMDFSNDEVDVKKVKEITEMYSKNMKKENIKREKGKISVKLTR